jgi:hypothetical protein
MNIDKDRNSWRLGNGYDWPKRLQDTRFTLKVLEITGKKNGDPVQSKWFHLEELKDAIAQLRGLDSGHIWISDGAPSIWGMLTTNRKRLKLNNSDCIYYPY